MDLPCKSGQMKLLRSIASPGPCPHPNPGEFLVFQTEDQWSFASDGAFSRAPQCQDAAPSERRPPCRGSSCRPSYCAPPGVGGFESTGSFTLPTSFVSVHSQSDVTHSSRDAGSKRTQPGRAWRCQEIMDIQLEALQDLAEEGYRLAEQNFRQAEQNFRQAEENFRLDHVSH